MLTGAALSNERGTLEAKVETLSQENRTLKTSLETEVDTVRIKAKLVSDLTQTVATLKQKLNEEEKERKDIENELKGIQVCTFQSFVASFPVLPLSVTSCSVFGERLSTNNASS